MNTVKNYTTIHLPLLLDRCVRSCNTLNDLSNKVYVSSKTEDLNLSMFSMVTGINESKTLTKHDHANVRVNLMEDNKYSANIISSISDYVG